MWGTWIGGHRRRNGAVVEKECCASSTFPVDLVAQLIYSSTANQLKIIKEIMLCNAWSMPTLVSVPAWPWWGCQSASTAVRQQRLAPRELAVLRSHESLQWGCWWSELDQTLEEPIHHWCQQVSRPILSRRHFHVPSRKECSIWLPFLQKQNHTLARSSVPLVPYRNRFEHLEGDRTIDPAEKILEIVQPSFLDWVSAGIMTNAKSLADRRAILPT